MTERWCQQVAYLCDNNRTFKNEVNKWNQPDKREFLFLYLFWIRSVGKNSQTQSNCPDLKIEHMQHGHAVFFHCSSRAPHFKRSGFTVDSFTNHSWEVSSGFFICSSNILTKFSDETRNSRYNKSLCVWIQTDMLIRNVRFASYQTWSFGLDIPPVSSGFAFTERNPREEHLN